MARKPKEPKADNTLSSVTDYRYQDKRKNNPPAKSPPKASSRWRQRPSTYIAPADLPNRTSTPPAKKLFPLLFQLRSPPSLCDPTHKPRPPNSPPATPALFPTAAQSQKSASLSPSQTNAPGKSATPPASPPPPAAHSSSRKTASAPTHSSSSPPTTFPPHSPPHTTAHHTPPHPYPLPPPPPYLPRQIRPLRRPHPLPFHAHHILLARAGSNLRTNRRSLLFVDFFISTTDGASTETRSLDTGVTRPDPIPDAS